MSINDNVELSETLPLLKMEQYLENSKIIFS